jgi:plasmid stability protein
MSPNQNELKGDVRRVTFYLPSELHRRLRVLAARTDARATELARRYIRAGLDADEGAGGEGVEVGGGD